MPIAIGIVFLSGLFAVTSPTRNCDMARQAVFEFAKADGVVSDGDAEAFERNPENWVSAMCGDGYEEGDSDEQGYRLCRTESKVCK